jgi:hypothetical protein
MAAAAAISKQPTKKLHSLKTMMLTIGFVAIGSQLIRTANAEARRWSDLWPPVFRVSGPGLSFWRPANFHFGRAQTDSIVDGDRLTQFM